MASKVVALLLLCVAVVKCAPAEHGDHTLKELLLRLLGENGLSKRDCPSGGGQCGDSDSCFTASQKCNNVNNCKDRSDEVGCECDQTQVKCKSGPDYCIHPQEACLDFAEGGCKEHTPAFCDDPCAAQGNGAFKCTLGGGLFYCAQKDWKCQPKLAACSGGEENIGCKREDIREVSESEIRSAEIFRAKALAEAKVVKKWISK